MNNKDILHARRIFIKNLFSTLVFSVSYFSVDKIIYLFYFFRNFIRNFKNIKKTSQKAEYS